MEEESSSSPLVLDYLRSTIGTCMLFRASIMALSSLSSLSSSPPTKTCSSTASGCSCDGEGEGSDDDGRRSSLDLFFPLLLFLCVRASSQLVPRPSPSDHLRFCNMAHPPCSRKAGGRKNCALIDGGCRSRWLLPRRHPCIAGPGPSAGGADAEGGDWEMARVMKISQRPTRRPCALALMTKLAGLTRGGEGEMDA